jgi:transposase
MSNTEITADELTSLLDRTQPKIESSDFEIIKAITQSYQQTYSLLQEKNITIKKLQAIIFGSKTEKKKPVPSPLDEDNSPTSPDHHESDKDEDPTSHLNPENDKDQSPKKDNAPQGQGTKRTSKKSKPGHGHLGAEDLRWFPALGQPIKELSELIV